MRLRALIVDDEPPARARLRQLVEAEGDIDIVGECADGVEAVEAIMRTLPHVLFLDVQMPELGAFEVLDRLDGQAPSAIVFVTAYDEYAVRAFDVHAVDYLLKPFDRERFRVAIDRVRARLTRDGLAAFDRRLADLLAELRDGRRPADRLVVKIDNRFLLIRPAEIDWVEAAGNYVRLHVKGAAYEMRESMKGIEARLPAGMFLRIHRSTIINVDRIREFQPWFHGDYLLILKDGTRLTVSRAYIDRLHQLLR